MIDSTDLDEQLEHAFASFDQLGVGEAPDVARGIRSRRKRAVALSAACVAVLAAGLAALLVAGDRGDSQPTLVADRPSESGSGPVTAITTTTPTGSISGPATTVPISDVRHWCQGFVGLTEVGRIYADCGPEIEFGIVDFVCTGLIAVDVSGRDGLRQCEPIAPNSNVPGIDRLPEPSIPVIRSAGEILADAIETTTYVIREGDTPIEVAATHCLTVDQLTALNEDLGPLFAGFIVGTTIIVRDHDPGDDCTNPIETTYVVQSGDWPLGVAEAFCVSLADLVAYNGWVSETEFPFPGTEVRIPPGSCADG